jgi:hypothetical protein
MNHEEALIRTFIVPEKRTQYLSRLSSPRTRQRFMVSHLCHMRERFAKRIDPHMPLVPHTERHDAQVARIYSLLRERGAPERCYVISASSDLDKQELGLKNALEEIVVWHDGTFISCIPGKLAYFEGEDHNDRYILEASE